MRISSGIWRGLAAALLAGLITLTPARAGELNFVSAEQAFDQGIGAYRTGRHKMAIEALEFAAKADHFKAQYYLARMYANTTGDPVDHIKAYRIFKRLTDHFPFVDRDLDYRAGYIAKAYLQLAIYHKEGIRFRGFLPANPHEAVRLLDIAASYYDNADAQFELAKLYLSGDGVAEDDERGINWLILLARDKQHAGAQATLGDIFWNGRHGVRPDPGRALYWVSRAVAIAPEQDRFWIEEIYQVIYCGSSPERRERSRQEVLAGQRRQAQVAETQTLLEPGSQRPQVAVNGWQLAVRTCPDKSQVERFSFPR